MSDSAAVPAPPVPEEAYGLPRVLAYAAAALAAGVLIAGFWNYGLVDGFGKEIVAGGTIGDTAELADSYPSHGSAFGFVFAAVAGLAATFTACNCVVFAMIPGLACTTEQESSVRPLHVGGAFVGGVLVVCALYGSVIGFMGAGGVEALNARPVRLAQAQIVFTSLGAVMLVWSVLELGLAGPLTDRVSAETRAFFADPRTKGAIMGALVGLFAVGRPYPVFREFLTYAAEAGNPLYGAGVMMVQGAGQILLMVLLFAVLVWAAGRRLAEWAREKPHQPRLVSGLALLVGAAFFIYYWGLSLTFDIGFWGYRLGWYAGQVPT